MAALLALLELTNILAFVVALTQNLRIFVFFYFCYLLGYLIVKPKGIFDFFTIMYFEKLRPVSDFQFCHSTEGRL